jgi:LuxR family maltose regulon positive regulatory protein
MKTPLLKTKLYIPPVRPELVSRPRLIEQLDAGLYPGRVLTLVAAPAGFGKTTLVSAWVRGCAPHTRAAWLSLDREDDNPVRFWAYLIAACQTVHGDLGREALQVLQVPQLVHARSLLLSLINDIAALPERFILVLDDYHLVSAAEIQDGLEFLLDHLPAQVRIVIMTRADPPFPLARLRVRGQLTEVREADLRFTPAESAAFLNRAMGLALSESKVEALEARTEGWIAGLQLAALSLQQRAGSMDLIESFDGSHRYVIDYLAQEVLGQQSDDVRDFLCQTSVLDRLTASLCDAVTGREDSEAILAHLDLANLFLIPLDDRRAWYRYHTLFADFLRWQNTEDERVSLHRRAARWHEERGLLSEAIQHALAAGDVPLAGRLIDLAAQDALDAGQFGTVQSWLDALPDAFVRADSALAALRGWLLLPTGIDAAASYIDSAWESLPADAPPVSRARVLGLRALLVRLSGDAGESIALSERALDLIGNAAPFARRMILLNLVETYHQTGDLDAALRVSHEIIRLVPEGQVWMAAISAVGELVLLLNAQGRLREAIVLGEQALARYVCGQGNPAPIVSVIHLCLGLLYYETDELARARQYVCEGLSLGQALQMHGFIRLGRIWLARVQWAMGETEAAWGTLHEAYRFEQQGPAELSLLALCQATEIDFHLDRGDVDAATRLVGTAGLPTAAIPDHVMDNVRLAEARVRLAQGRLAEARDLLDAFERAAIEARHHKSLIRAYILRASVARAAGHPDGVRQDLEKALRLAAPEGYRRAFIESGDAIYEMLHRVRSLAPAFVDDLLGSFARSSAPPQAPERSSAPLLYEPLSDRQLQVLRLVAKGLSNREIAETLFVTVGTVKKHLNNVFQKLDAQSRTQAVARARESNLLP